MQTPGMLSRTPSSLLLLDFSFGSVWEGGLIPQNNTLIAPQFNTNIIGRLCREIASESTALEEIRVHQPKEQIDLQINIKKDQASSGRLTADASLCQIFVFFCECGRASRLPVTREQSAK